MSLIKRSRPWLFKNALARASSKALSPVPEAGVLSTLWSESKVAEAGVLSTLWSESTCVEAGVLSTLWSESKVAEAKSESCPIELCASFILLGAEASLV